MQAILDQVCAFDDARDYHGLVRFLASQRVPAPVLCQFVDLLARKQNRRTAATRVAQVLAAGHVDHWPGYVLLALEAFLGGNVSQGYQWLSALRQSSDLPGPLAGEALVELTENSAVKLVIIALLQQWRTGEDASIQALVEILKTVLGELGRVLDGGAVRALDPASLPAAKGQPLLRFRGPSPGGECRDRRIVLAMREQMFPERPNSRKADMPVRITAAMAAYGWQVDFFPLGALGDEGLMAEQLRGIAARCTGRRTDMLLLDVENWNCPPPLMAELRAAIGTVPVVLFYADPWKAEYHANIRALAAHADALWSVNPCLPLWQEAGLREKAIFFPWLHGGYTPPAIVHHTLRMGFVGGVEGYNWTRAAWLAQTRMEGLAVDISVSTHQGDQMTALDSFHAYLDRVAGCSVSLNFSLRRDFGRTLTARVFEALAANSLLVQEWTPDMDYYLVDGRDYLSFETFEDLLAVRDFLATHAEQAEAIRRNGHETMRRLYGDTAIVGYFDAMLTDLAEGATPGQLVSPAG